MLITHTARWLLIPKATAVTAVRAVQNQHLVALITKFYNNSIGFVRLLLLVLLVEL